MTLVAYGVCVVVGRPLAVVFYYGIPFVQCSCAKGNKAQSAVWLSEHWRGDQASGIAALRALVRPAATDGGAE